MYSLREKITNYYRRMLRYLISTQGSKDPIKWMNIDYEALYKYLSETLIKIRGTSGKNLEVIIKYLKEMKIKRKETFLKDVYNQSNKKILDSIRGVEK